MDALVGAECGVRPSSSCAQMSHLHRGSLRGHSRQEAASWHAARRDHVAKETEK